MIPQPASSFRTDIQGLRAIAVLLVLAYHVWPTALPGGYIGVDVFFVISGYLITGLLARELEEKGRISLPDFYARRIRRLLPAASVTLVLVAIGVFVWLPTALWADTSLELLASGFYVENLFLVQKSVDYLALQEAPSPVQHYWSLSVEEQFYIFWPILMILIARAARPGRSLRMQLGLMLCIVSLASLAWGIYKSFTDPAPGYFLTTTRIWELGVGGLLALAQGRWKGQLLSRGILGWAGLLAILSSSYFYTASLPFPGYEALLPTLGAAALIFARSDSSQVIGRVLALRPVQYIGDISYSLYLWHWPVVVFYPYITGRNLDFFADAFMVVVISLALAHVSKFFIEDRLRHAHLGSRSDELRRAYGLGLVCMVAVLAASALLFHAAKQRATVPLASEPDDRYPGAAALLDGVETPPVESFLPSADVAKLDRGPAYGNASRENCIGSTTNDLMSFCNYGDPKAPFHVALVGDSHAVHWLPAFQVLAEDRGWRLSGITKSSCAVTDVTVRFGSGAATRDFDECTRWNQKMIDWLLSNKPDLVVVSMSPNHQLTGRAPKDSQTIIAEGTARLLRRLTAEGLDVVLIKHTPWQHDDPPRCMSLPGATIAGCSGKRSAVLLDGALVRAARIDPELPLLDFDDAFCKGEDCPVVIGNVFVYRDKNHLTATYAQTLAPMLLESLRAVKKSVP